MSDESKLRSEFWQLIGAGIDSEDKTLSNSLLDRAAGICGQLIAENGNDADACLGLAQAFYHRWDNARSSKECLRWLRHAYSCNPNNGWVNLYLGYQYWDNEQPNEAFKHLSFVDDSCFEHPADKWRILNRRELLLCCEILGDSPTVEIDKLTGLVD